MKALLIVLLILILLGLLKVGVHIVYDGHVRVQILIWKLRISLPKEKKSKKKPEKTAALEQKTPKKKKQKNPAVKAWLQAALAHWQDILALLGKALHMPRLDPLILHVTVGGSDPAARALNYGRAWAVLGSVLPLVENSFRIGRREIGVQCGAGQDAFIFYVQTDLTARIYEILLLGILGLKLLLQIYQEYKSIQKAVQLT